MKPRCLLQHLLASMLLKSKAQAADAHPECILMVLSRLLLAGRSCLDHVRLIIP